MECSKKSKCKNYREKCNDCMSIADIYNHYPCFKSVDVIEVVRCKYCKYAEQSINAIGEPSCCCNNKNVGFYKWLMGEDDFCSYGERRDPDA